MIRSIDETNQPQMFESDLEGSFDFELISEVESYFEDFM